MAGQSSKRSTKREPVPDNVRDRAVKTLSEQAEAFPDMPVIQPDMTGLDTRDSHLLQAIHRTVLERWITLEYILQVVGNQRVSFRDQDPILQAIWLSAAGQLLFMDRVPAYAAVSYAVDQTSSMVGRRMARVTNAVLRRVADLNAQSTTEPWDFQEDRIPTADGSIQLAKACLPPAKRSVKLLAMATSHPVELVRSWIDAYGEETARALAMHDLGSAPTIVNGTYTDQTQHDMATPHVNDGFFVWRGGRSNLIQLLSNGQRWVQDPTSASVVPGLATKITDPKIVLDYCAGRGTKTRQLAKQFPNATVWATDKDVDRLIELRRACKCHENTMPVRFKALNAKPVNADLILLDVPCSNTGVLGRRLEARYRYSAASIESLVELQREVVGDGVKQLHPDGGWIVYSTCSIDSRENEEQAAWICDHFNGTLIDQTRTLPGGRDDSYHDGGYFALIHVDRRS